MKRTLLALPVIAAFAISPAFAQIPPAHQEPVAAPVQAVTPEPEMHHEVVPPAAMTQGHAAPSHKAAHHAAHKKGKTKKHHGKKAGHKKHKHRKHA